MFTDAQVYLKQRRAYGLADSAVLFLRCEEHNQVRQVKRHSYSITQKDNTGYSVKLQEERIQA
jgi:hypothetical protein